MDLRRWVNVRLNSATFFHHLLPKQQHFRPLSCQALQTVSPIHCRRGCCQRSELAGCSTNHVPDFHIASNSRHANLVCLHSTLFVCNAATTICCAISTLTNLGLCPCSHYVGCFHTRCFLIPKDVLVAAACRSS